MSLRCGKPGVGKTYLARAFAQKAARDGFTVLYSGARRMFRELAMARADGNLDKLFTKLARVDVLAIDDWAMSPLSDNERRDFLEICDDRYQARSTFSPARFRLLIGTSGLESHPWLIASWTAWSTTPTRSS